MSQIVLQLFGKFNVIYLAEQKVIFSKTWDYAEGVMDSIYSTLSAHTINSAKLVAKTSIVFSVSDKFQVLEEVSVNSVKAYCVMSKQDYQAIISLCRALGIPEISVYSSLDYYRFLTKGVSIFLDEFSEREVSCYVFDGSALIDFNISVTSVADTMLRSILDKHTPVRIWNMVKYSIPIPEMVPVINFKDLQENDRIYLNPSFVCLNVKPSLVYDLTDRVSLINEDKENSFTNPEPLLVPPSAPTPKRSLFGVVNKQESSTQEETQAAFQEPCVVEEQSKQSVQDLLLDEQELDFSLDQVDDQQFGLMMGNQDRVEELDFSLDQHEVLEEIDFSLDSVPVEPNSPTEPESVHTVPSTVYQETEYNSLVPATANKGSKEDSQEFVPIPVFDSTLVDDLAGKAISEKKIVNPKLSQIISSSESKPKNVFYEKTNDNVDWYGKKIYKVVGVVVVIFFVFMIYLKMDEYGYLDSIKAFFFQ